MKTAGKMVLEAVCLVDAVADAVRLVQLRACRRHTRENGCELSDASRRSVMVHEGLDAGMRRLREAGQAQRRRNL